MNELVWVGLAGLLTALATGLGALPFAFVRRIGARGIGLAHALAAGLMLGASFGLLAEGSAHGLVQTVVGGAIGAAAIVLSHRLLGEHGHGFAGLQGEHGRRAALLVLVMTAHSFAEGVAVGVAFGGGQKLAVMITLAIAVHNVPEGLAISAVMRPRGASLAACAGWSVVSSLPQPVLALPAFVAVEQARALLPYGLGFAGGAMVYMVLFELLPEAYETLAPRRVGAVISASLGAMILLQHYL
ncbi:MAG: ZIP family metal transporter [Planctomycetota bacterium]|nr:MAG: ZIP family metal transporter [Planctomycetota bacterium]